MGEDRPGDPSFERALASARPTSPVAGRKRRLQSVLARVLGAEPTLPVIAGYQLERQVGAGGMGVVYRGHDVATGRPVAVKVMSGHARVERARFAREARVLRELASPRVVGYLDHGETDDGQDYLVMEWVEGEDLLARLRRGALDVAGALRVGVELAQALDAVHAAGITHRDVKPSNVILVGARVDEVRLIDFGIADAPDPGPRLTVAGAVLGTPNYMAPEQLRGQADARTDIYGLGATLFEALTGRPVFIGDHAAAIALAVMAESPPSLTALRPEVPGAIDALIGRMLAKEPGQRPRDMRAVALELAQLAEELRRGRDAPGVLSRAERMPRTARPELPTDSGGIVGRERALAQIRGILDEVAAEASAELIVVTGEAGIGKSRVLDEVVGGLDGSWTAWHVRARRDEAAVPFAVVGSLAVADADAGETSALSRALALGDEGIDPLTYGDRVLLAWLDRLEAITTRRPLLLAVDDAEHADVSSRRLIDRALSHLAGRAFAVVTTQTGAARPAADRPPGARVTHVHLPPLGTNASAFLAARWAPAARSAERAQVVAIAAGNPMHLQTLASGLGSGDPAALGTRSVAELIWSRLAALAPGPRRALRAAAIVGHAAWPAAVAALLGVPVDDAAVTEPLETLVAAGYLRPSPRTRIPGQRQLEFTSELAFLAAYELNSDADRRAGHAATARWLAAHAPDDHAQRARHLDGAGARADAASHHLAAAYAALAGGDDRLLDESLARAASPDAPPEIAGAAHALRAQALFWRGAHRDALAAGEQAIDALPRGTVHWFQAASQAITAAGQLGDHVALWRIAHLVTATPPDGRAADESRIVAACRALSQLTGTDDADAPLRAVVHDVAIDAVGPEARAWLHRADSIRASRRGFDAMIATIVAAHRAHVEQPDPRSAALMAIYLCSYYVWSGAWEHARSAIDDALRVVRRLGIDYLELWGTYAEAKLLVETAPQADAEAALVRVIDGAEASPRIRAGAQVYAALAAARADRHAAAIEWARAARATHKAAVIAAAATAAEIRSLLALGRTADAAEHAARIEPHATGVDRLPEWDELVRLAWAELALAGPDAAAARRACERAAQLIHERALTLADPLRRNDFLARPHLVARTLTLAARAP